MGVIQGLDEREVHRRWALVHADRLHFWPYGLNYSSEVQSEADLTNHCKVVQAIHHDMGWKHSQLLR